MAPKKNLGKKSAVPVAPQKITPKKTGPKLGQKGFVEQKAHKKGAQREAPLHLFLSGLLEAQAISRICPSRAGIPGAEV